MHCNTLQHTATHYNTLSGSYMHSSPPFAKALLLSRKALLFSRKALLLSGLGLALLLRSKVLLLSRKTLFLSRKIALCEHDEDPGLFLSIMQVAATGSELLRIWKLLNTLYKRAP